MLKLIDGPCAGTYLVQRAPVYLRAVLDNVTGETDVLDQIDDLPKLTESIFVYRLQGEAGWMHLNGPKIKGFYATGEYKYLGLEVDGEQFRSTEKWQEWALNQPQEII